MLRNAHIIFYLRKISDLMGIVARNVKVHFVTTIPPYVGDFLTPKKNVGGGYALYEGIHVEKPGENMGSEPRIFFFCKDRGICKDRGMTVFIYLHVFTRIALLRSFSSKVGSFHLHWKSGGHSVSQFSTSTLR